MVSFIAHNVSGAKPCYKDSGFITVDFVFFYEQRLDIRMFILFTRAKKEGNRCRGDFNTELLINPYLFSIIPAEGIFFWKLIFIIKVKAGMLLLWEYYFCTIYVLFL